MSCGLTKLTVAAHGVPSFGRCVSQSMNCWRISGSIDRPCPAPPFGDGQVPEPGQSALNP
jgi:hypothetical protein